MDCQGYNKEENIEEYFQKTCKIEKFSTKYLENVLRVNYIVKINFNYGGIEYPNLVIIGVDIQFQRCRCIPKSNE